MEEEFEKEIENYENEDTGGNFLKEYDRIITNKLSPFDDEES